MMWGSSPLARGGHHADGDRRGHVGLIPARAGRTDAPVPAGHPVGAHPRSRGADLSYPAPRSGIRGSSPLARGGPVQHGSPDAPTRAHPRSRGADNVLGLTTMPCVGSSPLARGGRPSGLLVVGTGRLIPARAGRTPGTCRRRGRSWAHPRSRGADSRPSRWQPGDYGSSPLARGGLAGRRADGRVHGLIPARAGRTGGIRASPRPRRAHPRSRGADLWLGGAIVGSLGSSPLARGGPRMVSHRSVMGGLIPARAGRTPRRERGLR